MSKIGFLDSLTAGGVASAGARVSISSCDEIAQTGDLAPNLRNQPALATPLVMPWALTSKSLKSFRI